MINSINVDASGYKKKHNDFFFILTVAGSRRLLHTSVLFLSVFWMHVNSLLLNIVILKYNLVTLTSQNPGEQYSNIIKE